MKLDVSYGGAQLRLQVSTNGEAILFVNGLMRDSGNGPGTLLVSSTVQTGYEWHELIEGRVSFGENEISASLSANSKQLAQETFFT